SLELFQHRERIGEMFQHIRADDGVISAFAKLGFLHGSGEDVAVKRLGVLGPLGIWLDGIDDQAAALEHLAHKTLCRANVESFARPEISKELCNLLMAALRVLVQPVVKHSVSSGGTVHSPASRPRNAWHTGCHSRGRSHRHSTWEWALRRCDGRA